MLDIETARRLVLNFLASQPSFGDRPNDQVSDIYRAVGERTALTDKDKPNVDEAIWDLIVQRVLTLRSENSYTWAFLRLTEFGKEVVKEQKWNPYDPDGYLKELSEQAPKVHKLCELYTAEALRCFNAGCYLGTSVMLGVSSEAAVDKLFQALGQAMKANGNLPEADSYKRKIDKEPSVYERYGLFKKHFDAIRPRVPGALTEDLDGQLGGVFGLIRYHRNESGHPTQTQVERMTAFRHMVLFVPYCRRIEQLSDWLEKNAGKLA